MYTRNLKLLRVPVCYEYQVAIKTKYQLMADFYELWMRPKSSVLRIPYLGSKSDMPTHIRRTLNFGLCFILPKIHVQQSEYGIHILCLSFHNTAHKKSTPSLSFIIIISSQIRT